MAVPKSTSFLGFVTSIDQRDISETECARDVGAMVVNILFSSGDCSDCICPRGLKSKFLLL